MHTYEGAGEYAEITVPSLTPSSLPANTKESTAAITAMDTSKQILVVPKNVKKFSRIVCVSLFSYQGLLCLSLRQLVYFISSLFVCQALF